MAWLLWQRVVTQFEISRHPRTSPTIEAKWSQVLHCHMAKEGATMCCPADSWGHIGHGDDGRDDDDKDIEELRPSLKRIHSDATITSGSIRFSYDFWRQQATDDIVQSLRPGANEALRSKPDGRIINGNTRIKVLEERGFDVNTLPREVIR